MGENPSISTSNNRIIKDQDADQVDDYKLIGRGRHTFNVSDSDNPLGNNGTNYQLDIDPESGEIVIDRTTSVVDFGTARESGDDPALDLGKSVVEAAFLQDSDTAFDADVRNENGDPNFTNDPNSEFNGQPNQQSQARQRAGDVLSAELAGEKTDKKLLRPNRRRSVGFLISPTPPMVRPESQPKPPPPPCMNGTSIPCNR